MKSYVGTKIINAEPMDKKWFEHKFKDGNKPADVYTTEEGYHVIYGNKDGEYHSWSPTAVFEEAYREISMGEQLLMKNVLIP